MTREELERVIDDALGEAVTEYNMGVTYDDGVELAKLIADRIMLAGDLPTVGA